MKRYEIKTSKRYEKDVRLAVSRGLDIEELLKVIKLLMQGQPLPERCRDHPLKGDYKGYRECHIEHDWLLVYEKSEALKIIALERTGTHADLFEKGKKR